MWKWGGGDGLHCSQLNVHLADSVTSSGVGAALHTFWLYFVLCFCERVLLRHLATDKFKYYVYLQ
jgi:hypothetical protein